MNSHIKFNFNLLYKFVILGMLILHVLPRGRTMIEVALGGGQAWPVALAVVFLLLSAMLLVLKESNRCLRMAYSLLAFVFYSILHRNSGLQSFDFFAPLFALFFLSLVSFDQEELCHSALLYYTRLLFLTYTVTGAFKLLGLLNFIRDGHSFLTDSFLGTQILLTQLATPGQLPMADVLLNNTSVLFQNVLYIAMALVEFAAVFLTWQKRLLRPSLLFFAGFHVAVYFLMDINFSLNIYLLLGLYLYFDTK